MKKFFYIVFAIFAISQGNAQDYKLLLKKVQTPPPADFFLRGTWVLDSSQTFLALFPGLPASLFAKTYFKYDKSAKEIEQTQYVGDFFNPAAPLAPSSQTLTTYNAQNLPATVLEKFYNDATKTWENDKNTINTYVGTMVSISLVQSWNNNAWVDTSRNVYTYNSKGLEITNLEQKYDPNSKLWVNSSLDSSVYDVSNRLIEEYRLLFDANTNSWENDTKALYSYTGTSKQPSITNSYAWDGSEWQQISQDIFTYNANNQVIEVLSKDVDDNGNLIDGAKTINTYDSNGNLTNLKLLVYDDNSGQFELFVELKNFWSMLTSTNELFVNKYECQIPNPYSKGQVIRCLGTNESNNYSIQLIGMNGQVISANAIQPAGFSLDNNASDGIYWLNISENKKVVNQYKLLIINR